MLVSGIDILNDAYRKGYAVGAFNILNLECVQAVLAAAEDEESPVILQTDERAIKYAGIEQLAAIVRTAAEGVRVPVALHLDHGGSFDMCMRCIRAGWTSVMLDSSHLPLERNIAAAAEVARAAHACGVSVEAELCRMTGVESNAPSAGRDALYTDPEEARMFAAETRVDSLAIAVGTAHGRHKGEPKIDMDRIPRIKSATNLPLVLHGTAGLPESELRKTIYMGINKISVDTELRMAFAEGVKRLLRSDPDAYDMRKLCGAGRETMAETARYKIRMLGSSGKAGK